MRGSSVPPMDPPSPVENAERASDDCILFTPRTERRVLTERAQLKRRESLALQKDTAQAEADKDEAAALLKAEKQRLLREQHFDKLLAELGSAGYTLAELLDYVFNPATKLQSDWRWRGFFQHRVPMSLEVHSSMDLIPPICSSDLILCVQLSMIQFTETLFLHLTWA
ncbi:hypothetical protein B0H10DRAFT_2200407 [Mycena sp. CBHHK59/15]|nr:hypothetical protein B0H10DRAFT_2200407 [Mycena sp. CBHHK59/15]